MFFKQKTILSAMITLLLAASVYTSSVKAANDDYLRVGVLYGDTAVSEYTMISVGGFIAGTDENRVFNPGITIADHTLKITISPEGIITYGNETFDTSTGQRLTFFPAGQEMISGNEKKYRGGLEFLNAGDGTLAVVNFLSVDDYVKGVVPREVPSSWHPEALKAQAVCARNYSITNKGKHESSGFDICPTTHCQVYGGVAAETPSTNSAVDATSGRYLMYNGKLAQTLFSSSTGGHTGDAKLVWGNDVPYLRGVENTFESPDDNPRYSWSKTFTTAEIEEKLLAKGIAIGAIKNITAQADPATGQVYNLTVQGTSGSHTFKNDGTRGCLGADVLWSQFYTVTPVTTPAATGIKAVTSTGKQLLTDYYVICANGEKTAIVFPFVAKSALAMETLSPQAMAYRFDGRGWGHGLGLSQYGAKGMADQGYTYDQILYHFYPGTILQ